MNRDFNSKIKNATKWSSITEIVSRLVAPLTSMVLARILMPEAYGVVATFTMIISFAEIFTDAGFQKYLIQHEFCDEDDRIQSTNVAFWSNLVLSLVIWAIIILFREPLAKLVGSPGLGYAIAIACISIPLAAFSSIQMALYKRDLDFKTLFKVRIVGIFLPILVTVPLAYCFRNFWALLIGTLAKDFVNALLLTYYSKWKPVFFYSWSKFKEMFSFSVWSVIEQVSIWLTKYLDIFIVGIVLNSYYLGLYRTSTVTVSAIMTLVTASTTPILFSSLSRLQNNRAQFESLFFKFQKWVGLLILPLGIGMFCYSDLIVAIMLGDQWEEACGFVGIWGLTSAFTIVFSHYCSEIYRSLGKPKLSVLAQWLHIIVLLPTVYFGVKHGYETLYIARSLVRFELIFVNWVITYLLIKLSPIKMIKNLVPELIGCLCMYVCCLLLKNLNQSILATLLSALVSSIVYFLVLLLFKQERNVIFSQLNRITRRIGLSINVKIVPKNSISE